MIYYYVINFAFEIEKLNNKCDNSKNRIMAKKLEIQNFFLLKIYIINRIIFVSNNMVVIVLDLLLVLLSIINIILQSYHLLYINDIL